MKTMKSVESLEIFSNSAFNKNHPEEKYLEMCKSMVKYAGGLPLALQALGSYLCGRREEAVWRDAINKLKEINPHKNILQVLKISYDGLDKKEKTIFLDIVCLFKGWKKQEVTQILKGCDLNPILGIKALIEKTLLVETEDGGLVMHELYEDLGWYIIHQEYPNSRLSKFEDIKEVLENEKGSREVEAIVMKDYYNKDMGRCKIEVHPAAFSKMSKLRLLYFRYPVIVAGELKKLPSVLKFVRWELFPLEVLPLPLDELVYIDMQASNIKKLWNGIQCMNNLKFIDLSNSPNIIETPDFTSAQSLERLDLSMCKSLVKIHHSLGQMKRLVEVDLGLCFNLETLPSKLETNSLRWLNLAGCEKVVKLPEFGEGMKELSYLDASRTSITTLPESFGCLTGLRELYLRFILDLVSLPIGCFSNLFRLVYLSLECCTSLKSLPRLPPRLIQLDATNCYSVKYSIDELWSNILASLDHEGRAQTKYITYDDDDVESTLFGRAPIFLCQDRGDYEAKCIPLRNFLASMPSNAIPLEFGVYERMHLQYSSGRTYKSEIEVYVAPHLHGCEWFGIVLLVDITRGIHRISVSSKGPEDDDYTIWHEMEGGWNCWSNLDEEDCHCCLMVLELNEKTCWQLLKGDNNTLHIKLIVKGGAYERKKSWRCRWRLISKEYIQERGNNVNQLTSTPTPNVKLRWGLLAQLGVRKD